MRLNLRRGFLVLALAVVAVPLFAATASAQNLTADAQLYELTENMRLVGGKLVHRKATSELMGLAKAGTPLCPMPVGAPPCTINATGSDDISLATGLGNFGGTFTVAVQGDNATDSPEFVIAKGKFHGKMDFSPAVLGAFLWAPWSGGWCSTPTVGRCRSREHSVCHSSCRVSSSLTTRFCAATPRWQPCSVGALCR